MAPIALRALITGPCEICDDPHGTECEGCAIVLCPDCAEAEEHICRADNGSSWACGSYADEP